MDVQLHADCAAPRQMTSEKEVGVYAELIRRCLKNDRRAQQLVYQKVHGKMLALCLRFFQNRDDALAVMNRGMLKVFNNLKNYRPEAEFEGWVYRIIQRTAIDELRKQIRRQQHEIHPDDPEDGEVYPDAVSRLQAEDILALTRKLPQATNAVFHLYVVEGYNHQEIADMLGISSGTSKWHLSSARKTLKNLIVNLNV